MVAPRISFVAQRPMRGLRYGCVNTSRDDPLRDRFETKFTSTRTLRMQRSEKSIEKMRKNCELFQHTPCIFM